MEIKIVVNKPDYAKTSWLLLISTQVLLIAGCAASTGSRPTNIDTPPNKSQTNAAANASSPSNTADKPLPSANTDDKVGQNKAPAPVRDCRVVVARGKIGSSNKPGVARVALAETQEMANAKLVRRNNGPNFEWVESMEFSKDGPNKPGIYSFEFRREEGASCAMKVAVEGDDIDKSVVLYLYVTI